LLNTVLDTFVITSAVIFVSTSVSAIKYACRSIPKSTSETIYTSSDGYQLANRGHTGAPPSNLREQLCIEQAMSNPTAGIQIKNLSMGDFRWAAQEGWVKMQQTFNLYKEKIIIHYVINKPLKLMDDFKIVYIKHLWR